MYYDKFRYILANQEMHRLNCLVWKKTNENLKWLTSVFAAEGKLQYLKMTPRMCYRYKGLKRSLDDNFHLYQKQLIIIPLKNESYDMTPQKYRSLLGEMISQLVRNSWITSDKEIKFSVVKSIKNAAFWDFRK